MPKKIVIADKSICLEGEYKLFSDAFHKKKMQVVKKLLGNKTGNVLDVGCYTAHLAELLDGKYKYFGLDIIKLNPEIKNFVQQDLNENTHLPFKNNFFDIVVCTEVLEHLYYPDKVATEISRVLKKDGLAVISLPNHFYLLKRLQYLLGKNFYRFGYYDDHWVFDMKRSESFVSMFFKIIKSYPYCVLPKIKKEVRFLANINPNLFAHWFFFLCKKGAAQ